MHFFEKRTNCCPLKGNQNIEVEYKLCYSVDKFKKGGINMGTLKIDYNEKRVSEQLTVLNLQQQNLSNLTAPQIVDRFFDEYDGFYKLVQKKKEINIDLFK